MVVQLHRPEEPMLKRSKWDSDWNKLLWRR